jgi:glyoxylase-like metal-dependent hydrolase (beta-lactamase superfamily II)
MCSSYNRVFTNNMELNSLAHAHIGCTAPNFVVSRWLNDRELIYLDDSIPSLSLSLRVLHTPGHTPDSISLYSYKHQRFDYIS